MPTTKSKSANKCKHGDNTPTQYRHLKEPWKPGQSGNPAGRPKGSRNKINGYFLRDLQALWEESGDTILRQTAASKPEVIVKAMVALLPKHVEASNSTEDLTDEELAIIAEALLATYGDPRTRRDEHPSARAKWDGREASPQLSEEAFSPKKHAALEQSN